MEQLDLIEIFKKVPKGTKLYSPLVGECTLHSISEHYIYIEYNDGYTICLDKYGNFSSMPNAEIMLFPSKEQRDWSKFELSHKFKIGDVIYNESYDFISIYKGHNTRFAVSYVPYLKVFNRGINLNSSVNIEEFKCRLATQEEKEMLYNELQKAAHFWNNETNSLEKYKFNIGDKIQNKTTKQIYSIYDIKHDKYKVKENIQCYLFTEYQNQYELYQEKFDITTLKPYDKVLVRHFNTSVWEPQIFSHLDTNLKHNSYKFVIVGFCSMPQCIPYEGNEHLVGTTNDCDEYYKTW